MLFPPLTAPAVTRFLPWHSEFNKKGDDWVEDNRLHSIVPTGTLRGSGGELGLGEWHTTQLPLSTA